MKETEEPFEPMYPAELYTKRPNKTALLSPLYDWTFKEIFTQETEESNFALRSFISAVLNREVKTVTLKNNEPPKQSRKQKSMTFDVSVQFDDGECRVNLNMDSCQAELKDTFSKLIKLSLENDVTLKLKIEEGYGRGLYKDVCTEYINELQRELNNVKERIRRELTA